MNSTDTGTSGVGYFPYPAEWLDAESEEIARSVSRWVRTECIEKRLEYREQFEHQMSALKILAGEIGLHRLMWPEAMGGVGFPLPDAASALARAYEEIGRGDPAIGYVSAAAMAVAAAILQEEDVPPALIEDLASLFCGDDPVTAPLALIPPGLGADGRTARPFISGREVAAELSREDNGWCLRGKVARPVNSGYTASRFAVFAAAPDGIVLVIIPSDSQGVKKGDPLKTTGLLASVNCDVDFDGVPVADHQVLKGGERLYRRLIPWLTLLTGALAVGSATDVYGLVKDWADSRVIKGKGLLKENPMDAAVLAQVAMDIVTARILIHSQARAVARPAGFGLKGAEDLTVFSESISVRVFDCCMHAVNRAMEMMGSAGYAKEWHVEKHWRDIKTMQVLLGGRTPVEMDVARHYYGSSTI